MTFIWDPIKSEQVLRDHGIDFARIEDVFSDPFAVEYIDEEHSTHDEIRFSIIGLTAEYGLIYLSYTETNDNELRFITARKAERRLVEIYDKRRSRI
jgi:uncharacterized protein